MKDCQQQTLFFMVDACGILTSLKGMRLSWKRCDISLKILWQLGCLYCQALIEKSYKLLLCSWNIVRPDVSNDVNKRRQKKILFCSQSTEKVD